ncbi:MAG: diphthine synthase [Thermoplasmata archaeon]|nr:MAG: diphthine synthase [Thermoplasmata archaeon]
MNKGSLVFIGLGLYDEKDITLKGFEEVKKADKVFAEFYTAKLVGTTLKDIETLIGKKITVLSREKTEKGEVVLDSAEKHYTVFLTAGDPMTATTHVDLRIRAIKRGINTQVVHGCSIVTAVPGLLGLQSYKFGRTTTLVFPDKNYFPTSPYEVIKENKKMGLHTLVLLDVQADKNRYMTANEGMKFLLEMEEKNRGNVLSKDTLVCVVARAGSNKPVVKADSIKNLIKIDFGPPLHTLVVPGRLHFMEVEALIALAHLPAQLGEKLQKI